MQAITPNKIITHSLMEPIEANARLKPNAPAVIYPSLTLTYRELVELVNFICLRFIQAGIVSGETVAITTKFPILTLLQMLSLSKLGCAFAFPKDHPLTLKQIPFSATLMDEVDGTSYTRKAIAFKPSWLAGRTSVLDSDVAKGFGNPKDTMMYLTTSGTTGQPKMFTESVEVFCRRVWRRVLAYGGTEGFGHSNILFGLGSSVGNMRFSVLWEGGTLIDFTGWPNSDRAALCLHTQTLAGSVMQLKTQADFARAGTISYPKLNKVIVAGSKMSLKLFNYFREELCPNVIIGYGSSEVGLVATHSMNDANFEPNSVGAVAPWCKVEIVDENDVVLPSDKAGFVRIQSPDAIPGYASASIDDEKIFRNGWFYPGDIGSITKQGHLLISGRMNDVINSGGVKVEPSDIEDALLEHKKISDAAAFALPDPAGLERICVAIVPNGNVDKNELRAICDQLPRTNIPSQIFIVDSIPRNDMGKIMRGELQKKHNLAAN